MRMRMAFWSVRSTDMPPRLWNRKEKNTSATRNERLLTTTTATTGYNVCVCVLQNGNVADSRHPPISVATRTAKVPFLSYSILSKTSPWERKTTGTGRPESRGATSFFVLSLLNDVKKLKTPPIPVLHRCQLPLANYSDCNATGCPESYWIYCRLRGKIHPPPPHCAEGEAQNIGSEWRDGFIFSENSTPYWMVKHVEGGWFMVTIRRHLRERRCCHAPPLPIQLYG